MVFAPRHARGWMGGWMDVLVHMYSALPMDGVLRQSRPHAGAAVQAPSTQQRISAFNAGRQGVGGDSFTLGSCAAQSHDAWMAGKRARDGGMGEGGKN